jgi:D-alanyl-D-alanine carboxypeptidase
MQTTGAKVIRLTTGAATLAIALTACGGQREVTALGDAAPAAKAAPAVLLVQQSDEARSGGNPVAAASFAELAVTADPQSFDARVALAKAYFAAGRFHAASEAYGDMAAMRPDDQGAKFRQALAELGKGNRRTALAALDSLAGVKGLEADVGLALALGGEAERAVALLEKVVRNGDSTVRVRQNLALAQALAGKWAAARVTAAIDLSPDLVDARVAEWAALASNSDPAWRTASVLGVAAAETDAGRPVHLAWAPPAPDTGLAAVEPTQSVVPAASSPVVLASAPVAEAAPTLRAEPVKIARTDVPAAVDKATAQPAKPIVTKTSTVAPSLAPKPIVAVKREVRALPKPTVGSWVVQVGAYAKPELVNMGWEGLVSRNKSLGDYKPMKSSVALKGSTYHRLSVGTFATAAEAAELCQSLKAGGQQCFVRKGEGSGGQAAAVPPKKA